MGRSSMPLRLLVHPEIYSLESLQALRDQGHTVDTNPKGPVWDYDLVLGPNVWRMTGTLAKHVPLAVKGARAVRYAERLAKRGPTSLMGEKDE